VAQFLGLTIEIMANVRGYMSCIMHKVVLEHYEGQYIASDH